MLPLFAKFSMTLFLLAVPFLFYGFGGAFLKFAAKISLREANRLAALFALAPAGHRPAAALPGSATLSRPVQECYVGLS